MVASWLHQYHLDLCFNSLQMCRSTKISQETGQTLHESLQTRLLYFQCDKKGIRGILPTERKAATIHFSPPGASCLSVNICVSIFMCYKIHPDIAFWTGFKTCVCTPAQAKRIQTLKAGGFKFYLGFGGVFLVFLFFGGGLWFFPKSLWFQSFLGWFLSSLMGCNHGLPTLPGE